MWDRTCRQLGDGPDNCRDNTGGHCRVIGGHQTWRRFRGNRGPLQRDHIPGTKIGVGLNGDLIRESSLASLKSYAFSLKKLTATQEAFDYEENVF